MPEAVDKMILSLQRKFAKKLVLFWFIFLTVLIILGVISSVLFYFHDSKQTDCNTTSCLQTDYFLQQRQLLESRLKKEAPTSIYQGLLKDYANASPSDQHSIAHIFGTLLYGSQGNAGITVCDGSFAFGCYHGFFGQSIAKEGIGAIKQLDAMCVSKYGKYNLGCQHGLGHGLAEYYGSKKLLFSLNICRDLSWKHQLMGCSSGVFMEYFMPTLTENNPGTVMIKPIDQTQPYAPCDQLDDYFQPECYYNLGIYFSHASSEHSQTGINFCEKISNQLNKKTCLLGFGNSAVSTNNYDIPKTIEVCAQASTSEDELYCRGGAAWVLFANPSTRDKSEQMCHDLSPLLAQQCTDNSNLLNLALKM